MRRLFMLVGMILMVFAVVGCGGGKPEVSKPDIQKPEATIQRPEVTPGGALARITPSGGQPRITPGSGQPAITPGALAKITPPGVTLPAITRPPVTVANVTPVSQYDAAQMIIVFAVQYLGTSVSVTRSGGAGGSVTVPSTQQAEVSAVVKLAGQTAVGVIASGSQPGGAEVAVGSGSITGDLNADISGASLGAFSLLSKSAPPADANAALALIRSTYPALANVSLQPQTSAQGGYVFYATTTHKGTDWKTKQVTMVSEAVVAGTTKQGNAAIVWAVVGNGTYATSVKP